MYEYEEPGYGYDPFPEEEPRTKPVPEKPKQHCRHCPGREAVGDGYGEFVHEDDYLYSCDPGELHTSFAEPV